MSAQRQTRRPNGNAPTKQLNVKVPGDVYEAATAAAAENGETLSFAVVRFLKRYGKS